MKKNKNMDINQTMIKKVDLNKLLKKKGLTLRELSRLTGLNVSYLSRANNGIVNLSSGAWEKIKKHL